MHHTLVGYFKTIITSVISSVNLIPVSLFTLVTIEPQFDSYAFGAVPQHLTAILISINSITSLNLLFPLIRMSNFSYHSWILLPRPIHSYFTGSWYYRAIDWNIQLIHNP